MELGMADPPTEPRPFMAPMFEQWRRSRFRDAMLDYKLIE
jgi:hypothetical protein